MNAPISFWWPEREWTRLGVMHRPLLRKNILFEYWSRRYEPIEDEE